MTVCSGLVAAAMLPGCSDSKNETQSLETSATPAWVLTAAPDGALGVAQAKAIAKEGDEIVIRGTIGGGKHPLSPESPVIRLVDSALYNKCTSGDDHCSTPWDYCCADSDELVAHSATIQLVDAGGEPITESPIAHGFAGLDDVVVRGTVGPRPNDAVLVVLATGIYRQ